MSILQINYTKKPRKDNSSTWFSLVRCNTCGEERVIEKCNAVRGGETNLCYKCNFSKLHEERRNRFDLTGKRINSLVVIKYVYSKDKVRYYECKCDCGKHKIIGSHILRKNIKTCGCQMHVTGKSNPCWRGFGFISSSFWCNVKWGAKNRKIPFNITIQEANDIFVQQGEQCSISGEKLQFKTDSATCDGTASLDRTNSDLGYSSENCTWVHKIVNRMKSDMSLKEFLNWCYKIWSYFSRKEHESINYHI